MLKKAKMTSFKTRGSLINFYLKCFKKAMLHRIKRIIPERERASAYNNLECFNKPLYNTNSFSHAKDMLQKRTNFNWLK